MITHNGYTFECDGSPDHSKLVVDAQTERAAIARARRKGWDVLRVRVVSGVRPGFVAFTVRRVFCPGCWHAYAVGVRSK